MRVLLMSSSSGSFGGGEQYLIKLGAGLARHGHSVVTGMSTHSRMDELAAACSSFGEVIRIPYQNTYDRLLRSGAAVIARGAIAKLKSFFQSSNFDVIHINKQNLEDGLDLMLAADQSGRPTVATIHIARSMSDLKSKGGWLRDWVASRVLNRANADYITVANHCRDQLTTACSRIDPSRVHAVWNGIDVIPPGDRNVIRAEWKCGPSDVVVGCVGRIEHQKNPMMTLQLAEATPENVKFVWIGDGAMAGQLKRAIHERNLEARFHLDGWRKDARQRMTAFDVFVLPSFYEGFPFAVLEAMAAGLPSIASDVDGVREAVTEGDNGFLCDVRNLDRWRSRLGELITDAALRQRMGSAAFERMQRDFSLDAMARRTADVYRSAIAHAGVRPS